MDGAGRLRTLWTIILPLSWPGLATSGDPDVSVLLERVPVRAVVHARTRALHRAGRDHAVSRPVSGAVGRGSGGRRRRDDSRRGDRAGRAAPHRRRTDGRRGQGLTWRRSAFAPVSKMFPNGQVAVRDVTLDDRRRRAARPGRTVGQRQEHRASADCRTRDADRGCRF